MLLLGLVFPKLSNSFPAGRVSRYTDQAGSTNTTLVKYEVELENYVLLFRWFLFVLGGNFPYLPHSFIGTYVKL